MSWDEEPATLPSSRISAAIAVLEAEAHDEYDRSRIRAAGMILRHSDLHKRVAPKREEEEG